MFNPRELGRKLVMVDCVTVSELQKSVHILQFASKLSQCKHSYNFLWPTGCVSLLKIKMQLSVSGLYACGVLSSKDLFNWYKAMVDVNLLNWLDVRWRFIYDLFLFVFILFLSREIEAMREQTPPIVFSEQLVSLSQTPHILHNSQQGFLVQPLERGLANKIPSCHVAFIFNPSIQNSSQNMSTKRGALVQ